MLLRKRIAQNLNRSNSFPNLVGDFIELSQKLQLCVLSDTPSVFKLNFSSQSDESARTRQKLEKELSGIQSIVEGLNKQGARLSQTMASLRHSNPDLSRKCCNLVVSSVFVIQGNTTSHLFCVVAKDIIGKRQNKTRRKKVASLFQEIKVHLGRPEETARMRRPTWTLCSPQILPVRDR